jgi:hypothetical protein
MGNRGAAWRGARRGVLGTGVPVVERSGVCGGLAADELDEDDDVLVDGAALFSKSLSSDLSGSSGRGASTSGGGKPSSTSMSAGSG